MLGNKLWNSFTSHFQLEILPQASHFKKEGEFDGPLLFHHFCKHVKPSTAVGSSMLKDDLESKDLKEFGQDLKKYHTWLEDCKTQIDREEGDINYKEYLRCVFRTYLTSTNKEFREAIKDDKRKWVTGKLAKTYTYRDLIANGLLLFNNEVASGSWEFSQSVKKMQVSG